MNFYAYLKTLEKHNEERTPKTVIYEHKVTAGNVSLMGVTFSC